MHACESPEEIDHLQDSMKSYMCCKDNVIQLTGFNMRLSCEIIYLHYKEKRVISIT